MTVQVSAVGFPLFKVRGPVVSADRTECSRPSRFRDVCHVEGRVSVLSNRREGTWEIAVAPPADEVGVDRSPWEGMSGAVVWFEGAIIGVITAHHRAEGLNRLAAVRVARWYEVLEDGELDVMRRHAGLPVSLPAVGQVPVPEFTACLLSLLSPAELWQVTDAITALPAVRRRNGLEEVLEEADARLAVQRPRDGGLRFEVHGLLHTCRRYPGSFLTVVDALRNWEQDSKEVRHVEHVLRQLTLKYG
jgi:hypothetical protein